MSKIDFGRWRRNSDNEPMAHVRIMHSISRDAAAALLLAHMAGDVVWWIEDGGEEPALTRAQVEQAIRDQLYWNREKADFWRDDYRDNGGADQAWEWAQRQVAQL